LNSPSIQWLGYCQTVNTDGLYIARMPLSWTVSHPHRLVHVTASGAVSLVDLRRFIEEVRDGGLRPYAKLVDLSFSAVELSAADVRALSQVHFSGVDPAEPRGPTALVVDSQTALDVSLLYDQRSSGSNRALAIFANRDQALEWLNTALAGDPQS
jgi:hypothetical protein